MYSIGKYVKTMQLLGRSLRMLLILGSIVICIEACSKDDDNPEKELPPTERPKDGVLQGSAQDTLIVSPDLLSKV